MSREKNKVILVTSFGTTHNNTRAETLDAILNSYREGFGDFEIYEAWTSQFIRKRLEKRDGIHINSVQEALEQIRKDGIDEVYIQPTLVIKGLEYDKIVAMAEGTKDGFKVIGICEPLLEGQEDYLEVCRILQESFGHEDGQALVLMGHGSSHENDRVYEKLRRVFVEEGCHDYFIGTVEGEMDLDAVISQLKAEGYDKVLLAPFMIVAGDHAQNDMAGDDSWRTKLEAEGFQVECIIKGLGQYDGIRRLFAEHTSKCIEEKVNG